ncbi:Tim44/TimA family putative adaptor protein [Tepidicaulis sp.]|uniref:Tim44/TimA family putative adaptor protein n=1 Tax=Tepidicaulis sp. TaxID=1920809 RepID=UPI003B5B1CF7
MGNGFDLLNLILLIAAVVVFWRLRSVLGQRTGHERRPYDPYSASNGRGPQEEADGKADSDGKVIPMPGRAVPPAQEGPLSGRLQHVEPGAQQGLTEIALTDRMFDPEAFLEGARAAYEMIVTAYAEGDRETLRPLLSDGVYASFEGAISAREEKKLKVEFALIGLKSADVKTAKLADTKARIGVKFVSEQSSVTKNEDGIVVEGDPVTVHTVTDIWTFERDTRSRDPNWQVVATEAGA